MFYFKLLALRLLAPDGASGGEGGGEGGGTAGVNAAIPGQEQERNSLEALGVPKDLAEKHRARRKPAAASAPAQTEAPAAQEDSTGQSPAAAAKTPWAELIKDPDYNKELQKMMSERVKNAGQAKAQLEALAPVLQALGEEFGLDTSDMSKFDVDALTKAVQERQKTAAVQRIANDEGLDEVTAEKLYERESLKQQLQQREQNDLRQMQMRNYFDRMAKEGAELKNSYPNFDIRAELENPRFRQYTQQFGMSVKDAFHAIHYAEIQQAREAELTRRVTESVANQIRSGTGRPVERTAARTASVASDRAPAFGTPEREALKARIRAGEKIYPR